MGLIRRKSRPVLEELEGRLALSAAPAAETLAALTAFTRAYLSRVGQANFNPAVDLNHNGQIGQDDGKLLLHALPPLSPKVPLNLRLTLAPQDKARGHVPVNLGGVTHSRVPTVLVHTTPGALVFTGTGTVDVKLHGPAYVADAQGNASIPVTMTDGINQFDVLVVDAYGQQDLRAFPILWLDFARYEAAHPRKT